MPTRTLPCPAIWPSFSMLGWQAMSNNGFLVNDDTDLAAFGAVTMPATGTLTGVQFQTGTITTGQNSCPIRVETMDATTGNPSGTLAYTNSNGTVDIASSDDNVALACTNINSGTGVSVTYGDIVGITIGRSGGASTLNGTVFRYYGSGGSNTAGLNIP